MSEASPFSYVRAKCAQEIMMFKEFRALTLYEVCHSWTYALLPFYL